MIRIPTLAVLLIISGCATAQNKNDNAIDVDTLQSIDIYLVSWGLDVFGSNQVRDDVIKRAEIRSTITGIEMSRVLDLIQTGDWVDDPNRPNEMWPAVFVADLHTADGHLRSYYSDGCSLVIQGSHMTKQIGSEFRRAFAFGADDLTRSCP
ncbi:MAG: hypothetical protein KDI60_16545 [Xanthomonadales bacterium]|nr:hypothetical protein [Xanthomonadales bacterium]MCB1613342.1 hypothetical protein [Xanthomonadales bacterium]